MQTAAVNSSRASTTVAVTECHTQSLGERKSAAAGKPRLTWPRSCVVTEWLISMPPFWNAVAPKLSPLEGTFAAVTSSTARHLAPPVAVVSSSITSDRRVAMASSLTRICFN